MKNTRVITSALINICQDRTITHTNVVEHCILAPTSWVSPHGDGERSHRDVGWSSQAGLVHPYAEVPPHVYTYVALASDLL
jgi:hypothetical protein